MIGQTVSLYRILEKSGRGRDGGQEPDTSTSRLAVPGNMSRGDDPPDW